MPNKAVVLALSGGIDSTTLLAKLIADEYNTIKIISFRYPSQHNKFELDAAIKVARHYSKSIAVLDIGTAFINTVSGLFTGEIEYGAYNKHGMATTVVPGRNLIFTSIMASMAQSIGKCDVAIGVHAGDHALYPDCREEWINKVDSALQIQSEGLVRLKAPFSAMSKNEIVALGRQLQAPYYLTRSCYGNDGEPCHKCGTCIERDTALLANGYNEEGYLKDV